MIGIYLIKNKFNGKCYVGQTKSINKRWKTHVWKLNNNRHHNKYLQNAWNKYGEENFEFTILQLCTEQVLNELEIVYIKQLNSYCKNNGYNLTFGGEGTTGHILSDESKLKIGKAQKGKVISQQHKEILSQQFSGEGNPFYDKKHGEEVKDAISKNRIKNEYSKGGNNCKAKKVICDGIIYKCAKDCADFYNIKNCTLRSWLRGDRPMSKEFVDKGLCFI